ncbi:Elongation of very long chain fatty acids protein, partial [Fragariocoptes setiger]
MSGVSQVLPVEQAQSMFEYVYQGFWDQHGDPRVKQYPMFGGGPWPVIVACLLYLYFVKVLGPQLMHDRKPFDLKNPIRLYNLFMVAVNVYGVIQGCRLLNYGLDIWGCRPINANATDPKSLAIIRLGYVFFTSRLIEFFDTICFTLRKKHNQVSAFHVFHHFSVPIAVWFFIKFAPGGNSAIFPFLNSMIHTVMYGYYFLATYPSLQPYLWWKKYLTLAQIVQFFIMIVHSAQPLFLSSCQFPKVFLLTNIIFSFIFIYLFTDFYLKAYCSKETRKAITTKFFNVKKWVFVATVY